MQIGKKLDGCFVEIMLLIPKRIRIEQAVLFDFSTYDDTSKPKYAPDYLDHILRGVHKISAQGQLDFVKHMLSIGLPLAKNKVNKIQSAIHQVSDCD